MTKGIDMHLKLIRSLLGDVRITETSFSINLSLLICLFILISFEFGKFRNKNFQRKLLNETANKLSPDSIEIYRRYIYVARIQSKYIERRYLYFYQKIGRRP